MDKCAQAQAATQQVEATAPLTTQAAAAAATGAMATLHHADCALQAARPASRCAATVSQQGPMLEPMVPAATATTLHMHTTAAQQQLRSSTNSSNITHLSSSSSNSR